VIAPAERQALLRLARDAIVAHVTGTSAPATEVCDAAVRPGAVFVSLHCRGDLRGCIGHIEADEPLGRVIARCAVGASSSDPRFPPVDASELPTLDLELSVMSPLEPIAGPGDIEVGRHGLVVEQGRHRGLLLPQVASEWKWDRETFLAQTCHKAGLPRDAWKQGAKIWRFEAEVFREVGEIG
jgi:AmmeMemoRadiSam system protein A